MVSVTETYIHSSPSEYAEWFDLLVNRISFAFGKIIIKLIPKDVRDQASCLPESIISLFLMSNSETSCSIILWAPLKTPQKTYKMR